MSKNVLHVVNIGFVLPYFLGNQVDFLKENNLDVTIVCSKGEEFKRYVKEHELDHFEIDILRKISIVQDFKSLFMLIRVLRKKKFDYVVGHTPKGSLLAILASWICRVPNRIYFRHGLVFETSIGVKLKVMLFLERLTSMLSTKVISVSPSVKKISDSLKLGDPSKNFILSKGSCNGVDTEVFKLDRNSNIREHLSIHDDEIVIGFVGRLVNDKGINELVEAWQVLRQSYSNIKLLLVGPFEERDSLSIEIKKYIAKEDSIVHMGLVSETVKYYNIMDIFILPSYREGFPTVVLEASSMSLPVITTRATGCIDSIEENVTGIYCDIHAKSIVSAIDFYIRNEQERKQHGKNGREWVLKNFKQEVVWQAILKEVYNSK